MLCSSIYHAKTDSDREVTTTSMPHTIVHVPGHQKPVLAEQIKAVNVPDTVGHILKKVGKDKDGTVFVNINLNGQTVSESTAIAHSSHVGEAIEWIKLLKDKAQKGYGSALDWITNNKKRFALYCFGGTYCITQFYLWHLAHSLQSSSCWSMWKHQSSLEDLSLPPMRILRKMYSSPSTVGFLVQKISLIRVTPLLHSLKKQMRSYKRLILIAHW